MPHPTMIFIFPKGGHTFLMTETCNDYEEGAAIKKRSPAGRVL